VRVVAPATTANLGPGFDVFGLALNVFHDLVEVTPTGAGITITASGKYAGMMPTSPERNTAGVVAKLILERARANTGVEIKIVKEIKPGCGLGSSGASAAAVAVALEHLLKISYSKMELISLAAQGESASAGFPHADNVAAAILGGFTIIRSYEPLDTISLKAPKNMEVAVAIPEVPMPPKKTEQARVILPDKVPLSKMVHNVGHASTIVAGFAQSDIHLIGMGMSDCVVEPVRARLIPGYEKVRKSALDADAAGVAISGAGPTMIAIVDTKKVNTTEVAEAMKEAFEHEGVKAEAYRAKPAGGVKILGGK
jgi:homoserine kinase